MRAAAEGVGMYFATGDQAGVVTPSTDPWVTAVGGTTLAIGETGNRLFETGWSDGVWTLTGKTWQSQGIGSASGGGASALWAEPDYQRGVVPSTLTVSPGDKGGAGRTAPDISALADPMTPFFEGTLPLTGKLVYSESPIGGTSLATPLIAGLVADAQQGQAVPFGFLNPVLYKLAGTGAIRDILPVTSKTPTQYRGVYCNPAYITCESVPVMVQFDAQGPSVGNPTLENYAGQVTLKGYDTMTGLGTPNGPAFDTALSRLG
jgi:subtilase family serine protease